MKAVKDHVIHTHYGNYVGSIEKSGVISFKGIPYAKPPIGELRWQPPQPLEENDLTMPADKYPPAPIQPDMPEQLAKRLNESPHTPQSEDCLYLNLWCWDTNTPKKAILFWIYGGSYTIGHASRLQERGEEFVSKHHDIVIVSCNYRLGVFGSLNLSNLDANNSYKYSCNLNLLDQQAALRWVVDNAESFGGDPDNITLYGHSAGSNAISHHLAIPESANMFQRAICQSSFLVGHGTVSLEDSKSAADKLFSILGIQTLEQALSCSASNLLQAQIQLFGQAYTPPVNDNLVVFPNELKRLNEGESSGKQLLIGNSTGEYDQLFSGLSPEDALKKAVLRNSERLGADAQAKLEKYAQLHKELDTATAYSTANNELGMTLGGEIQARACMNHNTVYKFLFAWSDPNKPGRAPHGAPSPFFFGNNIPSSAPSSLSESLQESWANFVRTGNPNASLIPSWSPYSHEKRPTMIIDSTWNESEDIWKLDYEFWKEDFPEISQIEQKEEER